MKQIIIVLAALLLLIACEVRNSALSLIIEPTPTLTKDQMIMAGAGAPYGDNFYFNRVDCVQAVESGSKKECVFSVGLDVITRLEWSQLFPEAVFYSVHIGSWRSFDDDEEIPAHESQDGGVRSHIVAWQDGEAYHIEEFMHLMAHNEVGITEANRELIAKSIALMSMPDYLGGEVRYLEWGTFEEEYDDLDKYTHSLKAWTEVWGCEITWLFEFTDQEMPTVSLKWKNCYVDEYGDYIEDYDVVARGCEGEPTNTGPNRRRYDFK